MQKTIVVRILLWGRLRVMLDLHDSGELDGGFC